MIRYEVWTRQESGGFTRKFPLKGEVSASFATDLFGRATLVLPVNHARLDDLISINQSNRALDTASVIRAYIGTTPIYDFYVESLELNFTDTGARVATVNGSARGTCFDRVMVRQYDWKVNPSVQPDWEYGVGGDMLDRRAIDAKLSWNFDDDNADGWGEATEVGETDPLSSLPSISTAQFLSGTKSLSFDPGGSFGSPHSGIEQTIDVDEDGRRITITIRLKSLTIGRRFVAYIIPGSEGPGTDNSVNGYTYNGIHFVELDNVATGIGHNPGGSTDGTWQTFNLDVTLPQGQGRMTFGVIYDHHALNNGPVAYIEDVVITGNGIGLYRGGQNGWVSYGTMTTWTRETHPITSNPSIKHTGSGATLMGSGQYINVEEGVEYTLSADVYHAAGANRNFQLRIRTGDAQVDGTILGSTTTAVATATNTTLTQTVKIPAGVNRIVADVLMTDLLATTFYLDLETAAFYPGFPPATIGKIFIDLLDDAAVNHAVDNRTALLWLTRTFGTALDSSGAAWDQNVEVRIRRGTSYRSMIETFENMGYEFSLDVNPGDETDWRLNAYNPKNMGTDFTAADGPAILSRPGLMSAGPFVRREPVATYAMVEGDELYWGEYRDLAIETNWGEIETYQGLQDSLSGVLLKQATDIITSDSSESLVLLFAGHNLTPLVDYIIGDTIRVTIGDTYYPSAMFRVATISVRDNEVEPEFQVEFQPV